MDYPVEGAVESRATWRTLWVAERRVGHEDPSHNETGPNCRD